MVSNIMKSPRVIVFAKRVKAFVSKHMWRMRKSSAIINLFFYSLTLAGVYLPFVSDMFPIARPILLLILYCISFVGLLVLGYVYDVVLRLWKEDNIVDVERNPYQIDLFTDKELQTMKVRLSNFYASYEAMRTNMLICQKLGISCDDLVEQLEDIRVKIALFKEWVDAGKITRPVSE